MVYDCQKSAVHPLKSDCISPLVHLWMAYMEWLWFYEFVTVHTTVKKAISNMLPLSVRIGRGKPNLEQNLLAALTVDSTV